MNSRPMHEQALADAACDLALVAVVAAAARLARRRQPTRPAAPAWALPPVKSGFRANAEILRTRQPWGGQATFRDEAPRLAGERGAMALVGTVLRQDGAR